MIATIIKSSCEERSEQSRHSTQVRATKKEERKAKRKENQQQIDERKSQGLVSTENSKDVM